MSTAIQINGDPSSFNLTSSWSVESSSQGATYTKSPTTATKMVNFAVNLPTGATVLNSYIHSEWGSPKTGYAIKTVNGTVPRSENNYNVSVTLSTTNGTNSYEFKFKANGSLLSEGSHSSIAQISNVYLYIEYQNPASSFTLSSTSVAAGGTVTANISAVDSSYTHRMTVAFGSRSATVTGTNTSASYAIPLSWLDQIPNAISGTATVKVETLSGSTVLGSATSSFTITCPDSVVPSVGTISTEVVDGHSGFYIKNVSKCKVTVSGYTAGTGATVNSVYISGNGNSVYANTMTSSVLSTSGTVTFTVKVTDSRGRSASGTASINVLPYEPIKINSVGAYRCTSNGTIDVSSGTSITACCEYTMSDVDENVASVRVFWRVYGDTSWTEASNWPDESGTWKIVLQDSAELDKQYEVRFLVADAISTTERIVTVSSASIFMAWNKSKQSIGFGTYPSESQSVTISNDWTLMIGTKSIEDYVRDLVAEILRSNGLIS